jgi:DNA-binding NtrC family response regulator
MDSSRSKLGDVLVVDDNVDFQQITAKLAELSRCRTTPARTLSEARALTARSAYDFMLIDIDLPDGNGFDLLDSIDLAAHGQIAIVTGNPSVETAVRAVRSRAIEYLAKPVPAEELIQHLRRAHQRAMERTPVNAEDMQGMLGASPCMKELFEQIRRVAPLDISVFVNGESGTGKELVARAIHALSRRSGPFVAVNCGAVAPDLLSSQLFGHERGSFTGAVQTHAGFFEQSEGGTLFLDEITEMPLSLQVYLLRVLENRSLRRVGGAREIPVDVRVIAATNRNPEQAVKSGTLRNDLYYRLLEFPLRVPALSERRDDIGLLARHFLDRLNARYATAKSFAPDALRQLCERIWPGNVRELKHAVQRAYVLADSDCILPVQAPMASVHEESDGSLRFRVGMTFQDVEREMLLKTLASCGYNKRQAARMLGITAKTIYNRLSSYKELGLISAEQLGPPETAE